ncbi:MAG TPA: Uma2 family endonuclease [Thermoguttaceae bacterium]|nr:Uma2 family endonuclease [Thermoguttaceae bacterium]
MSVSAHLTLAQYDLMIKAGVFDQRGCRRLEFIQGEIREMTPIGSQHEDIVDRLTIWSTENLPREKVRVRVQNSIGLPALSSAPEPDLVWVVQGDYSARRPSPEDILLVIEVAESSLAYDTGEKAAMYATAEIADYWVVDLSARAIEVRRDPVAGRYRSLQTYVGDADVRPLAALDVLLRPSALWEGPSSKSDLTR